MTVLQIASLTGYNDRMKLHNACGLIFHKNLESGVIFKVLIALQNKELNALPSQQGTKLENAAKGCFKG